MTLNIFPGAPSRGLSAASNVPEGKKGGDKDEKPLKSILVISGGEGYVDFRIGMYRTVKFSMFLL
jgi:hypothetical protein